MKVPIALYVNMMIYGSLLNRLKVKKISIYNIPMEELQ